MCHISIEYAGLALHWIRWGYDRSIEAIVLSPPCNTSLGDVKKLENVFRYIFMRDKPEYTLLQVLADMAVNHGGAEFAGFTRKKKIAGLFFFLKTGDAMVYRTRCNEDIILHNTGDSTFSTRGQFLRLPVVGKIGM